LLWFLNVFGTDAVIREILTLLTILLLEIAKTFGFTDKYGGRFSSKITFALTSIAAILKRHYVSCFFSDAVFTAFVASQRSSAAISSLPAAISFFAVKWKNAFLLPSALSNLTRPRAALIHALFIGFFKLVGFLFNPFICQFFVCFCAVV